MGDFCCKAMEKVRTQYNEPIFYPIYISPDHEVRADRLAMRLYNMTRGGRISQKTMAWVTIKYCPFCGKPVSRPEEDPNAPSNG